MAGEKQEDAFWVLIAPMILVVGVLWVIWFLFHAQILEVLRYVRYGELWVLNFFTGGETACMNWLRLVGHTGVVPSAGASLATGQCFGAGLSSLSAEESASFYSLTGTSMNVIAARTLVLFRWASVFVGCALAVYALFFAPANQFKTHYNLESFIKVQAKVWKVISPIVNFKPADYSARVPGEMMPDKIPPFAEAMSPEEWISWHRIPVTNRIIDKEAARRAMTLQLGPRWTGKLDGLPLYILALIAAMSLKAAQRRDDSDNLLGDIAECWTIKEGLVMPEPLVARIKKVLADEKLGGAAMKVASTYAYRTTAILAMLRWARGLGGVLAPAQFLWLRAVDRNLWYPMDNLGRRAFHTEGAGAMAHFMAELNARKPLVIPRVDQAIITINQFLGDIKRRPMPIPSREEPRQALQRGG